jgi:hypothetical protein
MAPFGRIQNQFLDIDINLDKIEVEEEGEGDLNCSANKVDELVLSLLSQPMIDVKLSFWRMTMTLFVTNLTI